MTAVAQLIDSRSTAPRGLDRLGAAVLKVAAGLTCYALAAEWYSRVEAASGAAPRPASTVPLPASSATSSSPASLPSAATTDADGRRPPAARLGPLRFRKLAANIIFAAIAIGWFLMLRPAALGGPATVIRVTGVSMEPGMHTGDLAVVHAGTTYEVGEVVAFRVPTDDGSAGPFVIHRIIAEDDGVYTLRGDNNDHDDPWDVRHSDIAGQLWWHSPAAGTVVNYLSDPVIAAAVLASLTAFLILAGPDPKPKDDEGGPVAPGRTDVEVKA